MNHSSTETKLWQISDKGESFQTSLSCGSILLKVSTVQRQFLRKRLKNLVPGMKSTNNRLWMSQPHRLSLPLRTLLIHCEGWGVLRALLGGVVSEERGDLGWEEEARLAQGEQSRRSQRKKRRKK
jgi:hypothetical protein